MDLGCFLQVVLAVNSMSTCGLVHAALMKTGKMYVAESEEAEFMKRCREFALQCVSALARLNVHQALQVSLPCPACFRTQYSADRQSDSVE